MNEELKIIIKAVTEQAKKEINEVKNSLGDLEKTGGKKSKSFGTAMKGLGKAAGIAATAAIAAFTAIITSLIALGKNTKQFREEQAKLNAAFMAAGSTAQQANKTYNNLFRFMGESDTAVEAAGHLAKLTQDEKELAEWTSALQGVYATFGKSLPIEGLTEAANETAKVGKVTGTLADALNWAGVSEDEFNATLANANSEQERQALIRNTLNGLYEDAARLYEENNKEIIAQNEAQARLDATTGRLGRAVQPLLTALNNLSNTILTALEPAIRVVSNAMTWLINVISKALGYVTAFITALTGKKPAETTQQIATGIGTAASGAGKLQNNLQGATKAAEKLKRTTAGFDELNIISSGKSESSGTGTTGSSTGAGGGAIDGGFTLDTGLNDALEETGTKISGFVDKVKKKWKELGAKLKEDYSPTITALGKAYEKVKNKVVATAPKFVNGVKSIKDSFTSTTKYVVNEFTPNVTNSFSKDIVPVLTDVLAVALEEAGLDFEFYGDLIDRVCKDVINPALESVETVTTDTFDGIGKAWSKHGEPFTKEYQKATDGLRNSTNTLYEKCLKPIIQNIQKTADEIWKQHLKPLWDKVTKAVLQIGTDLLILWNEKIKPVVDWIAEKIYPILVKAFQKISSAVKDVIGAISKIIGGIVNTIAGIISFLTGVFTGDWKKAWNGIKQAFKGIWDTLVGIVEVPLKKVTGFVTSARDKIKTAFNAVTTFFKDVFSGNWKKALDNVYSVAKKPIDNVTGLFSNIKTKVKEYINGLVTFIKTDFKADWQKAWNSVKDAFSGVWNKLKGIIDKPKTAIKELLTYIKGTFLTNWKSAWNSVKDAFGGIWDTLKSKVKTPLNSIITTLNKLLSSLTSAFNSVIGKLNSISVKIPDWVPLYGGNTFGINLKTFYAPQIPYLAQGGFVTGETLARIGEGGKKEVVLPLEQNTEWLDMLAAKLQQNTPTKIVLMLDKQQLGWASINSINGITKQTGNLQLQLV